MRQRRRRLAAGLMVACALVSGCLVGPDYRRPSYPVPDAYRGGPPNPGGAPDLGDEAWWELFQDETLVALLREALERNYDVRVAAERVLDARAQTVVARSFLFPTVSVGASASFSRFGGPSGQFDPELQRLNQQFLGRGAADLAWELDLWGRIRRTVESARAQFLAAEWARRGVLSTLVADVASAYFQLRALDAQLEVSRQAYASRQDSVRLVRTRLEGGVATLLDLRQAEILLEQAAEAIPVTERDIAQTENQISTLLGRNPDAVPRGRPLEGQLVLPFVPPGLPSALLERRPDIRQAEEQLVAANAQIGAAKAQYFPQLFVTGSGGIGGNAFNGILFGPFGFVNIVPSISAPLFTAGRIGATVDSADAQTRAAVLRYQQVIQQALREVADSLVAYEKNRDFRAQKEILVSVTRDAVRLSKIRYQGGVSSYLEVLDSESRRFAAELDLVRAALDERTAVVQLYRALGGGWPPA